MRTDHDILEITKKMVADVNCNMSDLAFSINRQPSALTRTLGNNPTVRLLQEVAWALGLGMDPETGEGTPQYCWLCIPLEHYGRHVNYSFRLNHRSPMVRRRIDQNNKKLTRYATWGRGPDYDPTDRSHLSQVYPAKALAGSGPDGAPVDSRFIQAPAPEPLHGKTTQGPGGAARQSTAPLARTHDEANELAFEQQMEPLGETFAERQARLSEGAPQGYRLSSKALADAPQSTFALWQQAGWDIDKLIHHGYLEVDPASPPAYEEPQPRKTVGDAADTVAIQTNPVEARRLAASQGCPEGWILSDRALEVSEDVTYEKLSRAMDVEQLKKEKYLVPRAWLGYD